MKKNKVCIRFCVFLLISFFSACTTTQKIEKGEGIVDGHEVAVESEEEIFSLSDYRGLILCFNCYDSFNICVLGYFN